MWGKTASLEYILFTRPVSFIQVQFWRPGRGDFSPRFPKTPEPKHLLPTAWGVLPLHRATCGGAAQVLAYKSYLSLYSGTARRSNQSILKEISPEYSLEGLMLKLKLQCFGHLMLELMKNWLIGKDPDAGKDWRHEMEMTEDEMLGWHHWLNGHELSKLWELMMNREAWRAAVHGVAKSQTWFRDWTEFWGKVNESLTCFHV